MGATAHSIDLSALMKNSTGAVAARLRNFEVYACRQTCKRLSLHLECFKKWSAIL
jgi:hypothetical protein